MSEMVDRVARALAVADGMHPDAVSNDDEEAPIWTLYVNDARAAIETMREPTKEMVNSAYENCHEANSAYFDSNVDFAGPLWKAMIDAALK